jgi:acyl-coenzyme A synthetase/AMP-(fatty) acid ligase
MLLASSKFYKKAHDVALQGLSSQPRVIEVEKLQAGEIGRVEVSLGGPTDGQGGIMLYTSGTTSKPVSTYQHLHN